MAKTQTVNIDLVEQFIRKAKTGQIDEETRKRVEKFLAHSEGDFKLVLKAVVKFASGDDK